MNFLSLLKITLALLLAAVLFPGCRIANSTGQRGQPTGHRVLLITGGHDFNEEEFFKMFFSLGDFRVDTISQPAANRSLLSDTIGQYDVIVFYDMWQDISEQEKNAFISLTEKGTGLVFLHHSLVSYQQWDEIKNIRGGKYYERNRNYPPEMLSGYKYDLLMDVTVKDRRHPVTAGMRNFRLLDEGYSNISVIDGITPLLGTDHPDASEIIAWAHRYNNSKVVYILPGHDEKAWSDQNYRRILTNAITWTGNKLIKYPERIIVE
jgi:uncharacterized protein